MYLPNILSITWSYLAVPVWGWEPIVGEETSATVNASSPGNGGSCTPTAITAELTSAMSVECAPKAMRMVVTGYEWQPIANWEWLANPDWQVWSNNKRDDSIDRARRNETLRAAQPDPLPPATDAAGRVVCCQRHVDPEDPAT